MWTLKAHGQTERRNGSLQTKDYCSQLKALKLLISGLKSLVHLSHQNESLKQILILIFHKQIDDEHDDEKIYLI